MERIAAVVIGSGQAGLAASHELTGRGVEHVVLEAGVVGQTWRTRRWRSFHLVSPNWLNRLPGFWYDGPEPDGFLSTAGMVDYLESYATAFGAPLRTGTPVRRVSPDGDGFKVETGTGALHVRSVIVATGAFGHAHLPAIADAVPAGVRSIHTDGYWAPEDLPDGGVVVVGAGQSGLQLADELVKTGRDVWVAIGRHGWVPRTVLGKDQMHWRLEMGDFMTVVGDPSAPASEYPFSPLSRWGAGDFNVRTVWRDGVRLAGHLEAIDGTRLRFGSDIATMLADGDAYARAYVERVRVFVAARDGRAGEPDLSGAWAPGEIPEPVTELDVVRDRIGTIVWTTGYRQDFSWIRVPGALSTGGMPYQREGASPVPGLSFVGLHRGWHAADGTVLGAGWLATPAAEAAAARAASGGPARR